MTMNWLPLLLLAGSPSPDSRALDPATTAAIVEPLEKCLRSRIAAHRVEPAQVGRDDAARNFATWQMSLCGAGDVQSRLIAAMRSVDSSLTSDEALRRAGALLGTVLSEAAMQASKHFKVPPIQVQMIICPRKTEPQPEACKESPAPTVAPIEIPYQADAFFTYQRCVKDRFQVAMRSVHNLEEARQAHFDLVAACRDVRAIQLARALEQVTDRKIYGSRAKAQAMARLAFDRFDREFDMEWETASAPAGTAAEKPDGGVE
jgi:hypothetical protein